MSTQSNRNVYYYAIFITHSHIIFKHVIVPSSLSDVWWDNDPEQLSFARCRSQNHLAHPSNHLCCNSIITETFVLRHFRRSSRVTCCTSYSRIYIDVCYNSQCIVSTNLLFGRTLYVASQPDLPGASFSIVHHGKMVTQRSMFTSFPFSTVNLAHAQKFH